MAAHPKRTYTLEEYFELERSTNERLEYWNGDVFSMSSGSHQHDQIEGNTFLALRLALRDREWRVLTGNMRIKVPSLPPYRYADVSALCERPTFEKIGGVDTLTNPALIIEVLSDSTEAYDRGDKFTHYKSIPAFAEYLLIAQHRPHITQYTKLEDGSLSYRELNDVSASVDLSSVDCVLELTEVYRDVAFPDPHSANIKGESEIVV